MNSIEPATLSTVDNVELEAELSLCDAPRGAVVIAHPHPQHGGDMFTPVPAALFHSLETLGLTGIRFNFRGVGRSTGTHDGGAGEQLDIAAAIDAVMAEAPGVPLVLAGWSFGADVSLALGDERIAGWFLAAAVLRIVDPLTMGARRHPAPKRFVIGEADQFAPPEVIEAQLDGWTATSTVALPGADHFFGGLMQPVVDEFARFIAEITRR